MQRGKCCQIQFVIDGKHYSVVDAYTPFGFLCGQVFGGSFTDIELIHFLRTKVRPFIENGNWAMLDNAKVNLTSKI